MSKAEQVLASPRSRRAYALPSLFTTANIFCGFYAVIAALKGYQALPHDVAEAARLFDNAAKAIGFAVLFDSLDGSIARMTRTTSDFGIELDSLADVLSFGIAAAVLAYTWGYGSVPEGYGPEFSKIAWAASFLYLACGAFRLARFNVHTRRTITSVKKERRQFVGLPIPAAAGLIAAIVHFSPTPLIVRESLHLTIGDHTLSIGIPIASSLFLGLVCALSILMISTIRHRSFKDLRWGTVSPRWSYLFFVLLGLGIYFYSRWVLLILAVSYATHGIALRTYNLLRFGQAEAPTIEPVAKS
jgi:CDP-diacylglycerol--serine O-phosphatidyltransferase